MGGGDGGTAGWQLIPRRATLRGGFRGDTHLSKRIERLADVLLALVPSAPPHSIDLVEHGTRRRELIGQRLAHADGLAALAGEYESNGHAN